MRPRPGDGEASASPSRTSGRRKPPRIAPADMAPADRRDAAYNAALRLLAARERSEHELRARLAQKGYDRETVIATLDRLQGAGLQDDARFAGVFADSSIARGHGSGLIRSRLRQKGVDAELAAQASVTDPDHEEARAREAAARRARSLGGLAPDAARRRLAAYLARRGYPHDVCRAVVDELYPDGSG